MRASCVKLLFDTSWSERLRNEDPVLASFETMILTLDLFSKHADFATRGGHSQASACFPVSCSCRPHHVPVTFRALQVTKKADILTPLGALYYNTGRYEEALQVYREATSLQPDNTDIWLAFVSMCTPTQPPDLTYATSACPVRWLISNETLGLWSTHCWNEKKVFCVCTGPNLNLKPK